MKAFKDRLRILIAAGGTGGHLFPALEVARKIESLGSIPKGRLRIEFVGVGRPIEEKVLAPEGFVHHIIPGIGLKGKGIKGFLNFLKGLPACYHATKDLIDSYRPDIVVGFGGYPTVLPILVARMSGIPTWIHEADSSAGWATKFLSLFASKISSGFEKINLPLNRKTFFSGHPVRAGILPAQLPDITFLPKTILVLGGSQGARSLDCAMPVVMKALEDYELKVKHQARANQASDVLANYQESGIKVEVLSFISDMASALSEADIIISRAGAGAVMELSILNKPVIFVPLPHVSGHQLHNARSLERYGKAIVIEEGDNFELRVEDALRRLLDVRAYREMMAKPFVNRKTSAALSIAEALVEIGLKGKTFS